MKIITILGARPQFVKAAAVSHALRKTFNEIIVHTGQHYDANMSDVFFDELNIPRPNYHLNIGSGNHGAQTGAMLAEIEKILLHEKPDMVMVYGDTNSTLAGALAASKLLIPVVHVEAGLRSFNKVMPEEQNRILTDHLSSILFAPTQTAVANLAHEGITQQVHLVGDVMFDAVLHFVPLAEQKSTVLQTHDLRKNQYHLCTIHRAENTNDVERLKAIIHAINASNVQVVLPLHPRTKKYMNDYGIACEKHVKVIEPVGYLDMISLEKNAVKIITDSGGVQKEAYFMAKPCITLRDQTEWVETVNAGWNVVVGANQEAIQRALFEFNPNGSQPAFFGDGKSVEKMVKYILAFKGAN